MDRMTFAVKNEMTLSVLLHFSTSAVKDVKLVVIVTIESQSFH